MAKIIALKIDGSGPDAMQQRFYVNETSVGQGRQNSKKSDIELVQFFLRQYYKRHPELFKLIPITKTRATMIKIDGIAGPQTIEGIRQFQKRQKTRGYASKADGVVDIPTDTQVLVLASARTIILLNEACRRHNPEIDMTNLTKNPEIRESAPHLLEEIRG